MCVWFAGDMQSSTASQLLSRYLSSNPDGVFYAVRGEDGSSASKRYLPKSRSARVSLPKGTRVVAHLRLATSKVAESYIHGWQLDMQLPGSERWFCTHNGVGVDHRDKGVDSLSFYYELREQLHKKSPQSWEDAANVIRRVYQQFGEGRYMMASEDLDAIIVFGDVSLYRVYSSYVVASRSLEFDVLYDGLRFKPARTSYEGLIILEGTPLRIIFRKEFPASTWGKLLRKSCAYDVSSTRSWYGGTLPASRAWKCLCSYSTLALPVDVSWRVPTIGHFTATGEVCCPHHPLCSQHHASKFDADASKEVVGWGNNPQGGYHVLLKDGTRLDL